MNRRIILTLIIALFSFQGMAQKLPNWVVNKPAPTNDTYLYVVESATGKTEVEARNRAIAEVMRTTAMRLSQPFDSEEISRALQSGREYGVISAQYNIPIYKVCEHVDNNASPCRVYILCQVAKTGDCRPVFDDFNACYEGNDKYYGYEALYLDGGSIYKNGKKLGEGEVRTLFANSKSYELYDKGMRLLGYDDLSYSLYAGGGVLIGLGTVIGVVGGVVGNELEDGGGKPYVITGAAFGACGLGLILTGYMCSPSVGKAKIRKAVNLYNNGRMYSQSELEMEYGLMVNGLYFTFSF